MRSEQDLLADRIRDGNLLAVLATFFGVRTAAGVHALRAADGADPLRHHRRRRATASRSRAAARSRCRSPTCSAWRSPIRSPARSSRLPGQQAQAFFQKPWMIALFAALFVWLALGMFGLFNLQVPAALQERVSRLSNQQQAGHADRHRGHGRAVVADRHGLRRAAAGRRARGHRPERRRVPRRRGAVRAQPGHGRTAAAGRRVGRPSCCRRPAPGWTPSRRCSAS